MILTGILYFQLRMHQYLYSTTLRKSLTTTTSTNFRYLGIEIAEKEKTYSALLTNCRQLPHGKAVHAHLVKTSCMSSLYLQNTLLNLYVKRGDIASGRNLFDEMPQRNVVSWSSLITGFVQNGYHDEGLFLFSEMYNAAVRPNEFTMVSALSACSCIGYISKAYQIYALIVRLGFEWNVFVVNAFVTALIRNGLLTDAMNAFDSCSNKDIVSWNAMVAGFLQFSASEIPGFWLRMIREGAKPDGFTFSTVMSGLAALGDSKFGVQVHGNLVKSGHGSETCVGNSVLDMYLKSGDLAHGFKAFHEINYKNVVSWTSMASGCVNCCAPSQALDLLGEMKMMGIRPNGFSLATAFKACANMASLEEGKKAHGLRIKIGTEIDVCVDNALLDMYAKCGYMDDATLVFQRMKSRTIITWTVMIMGFAQNGQSREALGIFDEMVKQDIEPNYITFVCVLYACSQGGFVTEGWMYFSSMNDQYGISPGEDHYACMVDLLGRTGHIKEAEELISKMPFQPGPLIWETLVGACHIHGDIEAGKRAANRALLLNQRYPSTYIQLSNMFAGFSHWEGAKTFRDLMHARNVNKIPGTSSLTLMDIA